MDEPRLTHTDGGVEPQNSGLYPYGTWGLDIPSQLLPWLRPGPVARSKITFDHMLLDTASEEYRLLLDKFFR